VGRWRALFIVRPWLLKLGESTSKSESIPQSKRREREREAERERESGGDAEVGGGDGDRGVVSRGRDTRGRSESKQQRTAAADRPAAQLN